MAVDRKDRWTAHRRVAPIRGGGAGGGGGDAGGADGNSNGCSDLPWVDPPVNPRTPPTNPQSLEDRLEFVQDKDEGEDGHAPAAPPGGLTGADGAAAKAPPLVASSAPLLPEALPAGPVNPSSRSVPVLRLSADGAAVETTVWFAVNSSTCVVCGPRPCCDQPTNSPGPDPPPGSLQLN